MFKVRLLTREDIPASRKLWQDRFGDSDRFMDWYFANRFVPELSAGVFREDGYLISQAHGRALTLKAGDSPLSVLMIGGVSTDELYEKQGHMHRVLSFLNHLAAELSFDALFLAAEHPEIYHSSGFLDCGSCIKLEADGSRYSPALSADSAEDTVIEQIYEVYRNTAYRYNYASVRSLNDMRKRVADCFSAGFRLVTVAKSNTGTIAGYAFYDAIFGATEEVYAETGANYKKLIALLPAGTEVTLPPDANSNETNTAFFLIKPLKASLTLPLDPIQGYCAESY